MLYDTGDTGSYKDITGGKAGDGPVGNARDMIEEGQTFELINPQSVFENSSGGALLAPVKHGGETRFIEIPPGTGLLAKREVREEYRNFGTIITAKEKVDGRTFLGFPGGQREKPPRIYDLACFFRDAAFLDTTVPEVWSYRISADKRLYEEKEAEKWYFPPGTVFRVKDTCTTSSHKAWQLEIYSMDIYCRIKKNPAATVVVNTVDTVEIVPVKFWMGDKIFEYGAGGDGGLGPVQYYTWQESTDKSTGKRVGRQVAIDPVDSIENFVAAFRNFLLSIENRELTCVEALKDKVPKYRFEFYDSAAGEYKLGAAMEFWVYAGAFSGEPDKESAKVSWKGGELPVYSSNPLEAPFRDVEKGREFMGVLYARSPCSELQDTGGARYLGFSAGGRTVYLEEEQARACRTNMRDWAEHFRRKDSDANGDIFCERGLLDGFKNLDPPARRELIVRHPLEWDRSLYTTRHFRDIVFRADEEGYDLLQKEAAVLDIWEGLKQTGEFEKAENDFLFAHPVYFINHLERMGAFEVNPYFGKHTTIGKVSFECFTNPGFAPLGEDKQFKYNDECYAGISGLFNADYVDANTERSKEDWKEYWHEGVDFRVDSGTPIKSFIYGTVIKTGLHDRSTVDKKTGMGGFIVVQDAGNLKLFYVLVHLKDHDYVKPGDKVYPGLIVGTVGRDLGGVSGPHLHLTHVMADSSDEVIRGKMEFQFWLLQARSSNASEKKIMEKVVDPFDHSKKWKGRFK
jgi:hypothetical protein